MIRIAMIEFGMTSQVLSWADLVLHRHIEFHF